MNDRLAGIGTRLRETAEGLYLLAAAAVVMATPVARQVWAVSKSSATRAATAWKATDSGAKGRLLLGLGILAALLLGWTWREVPGHWLAYQRGERPLYAAQSWHYQLDKVDVDQIAKVKADVIVTDFARSGGRIPLTPEEVTRLKTGPDGKRRLVISYMSIGEAEQYRFYFREEWKTDPPDWLGKENCAWPQAHKVAFWHDSWKDTIWRGRKAYLKRIIDAGFDGVYLDRVDIYEQFPERPTAREDMIAFVQDLSRQAKSLKPNFLVIPQNADDLLTEPSYLAAIDGLGREDLLFGATAGTGKRNSSSDIAAAQKRLDRLVWEWKPVLAVEYLQTQAHIDEVRKEMKARGLVPTFQPRALDGTDPTAPIDLKKDVGTSEYVKENCPKGSAW